MTNKDEYISRRNIADVLYDVVERAKDGCPCLIEAVSGEENTCPISISDEVSCKECFNHWLTQGDNGINIHGRYYPERVAQQYIQRLENVAADLEDRHWGECRMVAQYDQNFCDCIALLLEADKLLGSTACYATMPTVERVVELQQRIHKFVAKGEDADESTSEKETSNSETEQDNSDCRIIGNQSE